MTPHNEGMSIDPLDRADDLLTVMVDGLQARPDHKFTRMIQEIQKCVRAAKATSAPNMTPSVAMEASTPGQELLPTAWRTEALTRPRAIRSQNSQHAPEVDHPLSRHFQPSTPRHAPSAFRAIAPAYEQLAPDLQPQYASPYANTSYHTTPALHPAFGPSQPAAPTQTRPSQPLQFAKTHLQYLLDRASSNGIRKHIRDIVPKVKEFIDEAQIEFQSLQSQRASGTVEPEKAQFPPHAIVERDPKIVIALDHGYVGEVKVPFILVKSTGDFWFYSVLESGVEMEDSDGVVQIVVRAKGWFGEPPTVESQSIEDEGMNCA